MTKILMNRRLIVASIVLTLFSFTQVPVLAGGQEEITDFDEVFESLSWDEIVDQARGQEVFWYMWGGSEAINTYVTEYLGGILKTDFDITLTMVPVTDSPVYVTKILGELGAGRTEDGSVDLIWVNGENFKALKEVNALFGPYLEVLPNSANLNLDSPDINYDFGYPVEGYESPYGSAQVVLNYDSARVDTYPTSMSALLEWIKQNPGKFTYPAPPDFTGSAFVRHVFYYAAGGYERLLGEFDQEVFDDVASKTWDLLNDIEPYLWREGNTYPESSTLMQDLFANGEIYFDISYNPSNAPNLVEQGRYPETTKTFVFDEGTIGNTHFVAIPSNASHKAAALVLANLILDPRSQAEKMLPSVWGDLTALDLQLLDGEDREVFDQIPQHPSGIDPAILSSRRLPELSADWLEAIESAWIQEVLYN